MSEPAEPSTFLETLKSVATMQLIVEIVIAWMNFYYVVEREIIGDLKTRLVDKTYGPGLTVGEKKFPEEKWT